MYCVAERRLLAFADGFVRLSASKFPILTTVTRYAGSRNNRSTCLIRGQLTRGMTTGSQLSVDSDSDSPVPPKKKNPSRLESVDMGKLIVFEDNHMLIMNKSPLLLTQGDLSGSPSMLEETKKFIAKRDGKPGEAYIGLVHRLDRPCSGVMIFAKTSKAAARLSESFRERLVGKDYLCVVNGDLKGAGRLQHLLVKSTAEKVRVVEQSSMTKKGAEERKDLVEARLQYEAILSIKKEAPDGSIATQTLVRILLETGRKHQIRAQLGHIGHPIVGDVKYGASQSFRVRDIALHSYAVTIAHPITKEQMRFTAPPPVSWQKRFGVETMAAAEVLRNKV